MDNDATKIALLKLANTAVLLGPRNAIKVDVRDKEVEATFFIGCIKFFGSNCLIANVDEGGQPLIIDVSTYYAELANVVEVLMVYIRDLLDSSYDEEYPFYLVDMDSIEISVGSPQLIED